MLTIYCIYGLTWLVPVLFNMKVNNVEKRQEFFELQSNEEKLCRLASRKNGVEMLQIICKKITAANNTADVGDKSLTDV